MTATAWTIVLPVLLIVGCLGYVLLMYIYSQGSDLLLALSRRVGRGKAPCTACLFGAGDGTDAESADRSDADALGVRPGDEQARRPRRLLLRLQRPHRAAPTKDAAQLYKPPHVDPGAPEAPRAGDGPSSDDDDANYVSAAWPSEHDEVSFRV